MEVGVATAILSSLGEFGIFGLGWLAFLWAMIQLKHERTRYQHLVVHIIQYFTKINILHELDTDEDSHDSTRRQRPLRPLDGPLGRIFGHEDDDFEKSDPRGRGTRSSGRGRDAGRSDAE